MSDYPIPVPRCTTPIPVLRRTTPIPILLHAPSNSVLRCATAISVVLRQPLWPSAPYAAPYQKPPKDESHSDSDCYPAPASWYGTPCASLESSVFPPSTEPNMIACFLVADQDGSGFIDDKELQRAHSSYNQSFSLRTVHRTRRRTRVLNCRADEARLTASEGSDFHFGCGEK